jgi:hypothetical protein
MVGHFRLAPVTVSFPAMRNPLLGAAALILATASCATPKFQADVATQLRAAADEMQIQRQDMATMQEQIDSLKVVAAKQDTLLKNSRISRGFRGAGNRQQGTGK